MKEPEFIDWSKQEHSDNVLFGFGRVGIDEYELFVVTPEASKNRDWRVPGPIFVKDDDCEFFGPMRVYQGGVFLGTSEGSISEGPIVARRTIQAMADHLGPDMGFKLQDPRLAHQSINAPAGTPDADSAGVYAMAVSVTKEQAQKALAAYDKMKGTVLDFGGMQYAAGQLPLAAHALMAKAAGRAV